MTEPRPAPDQAATTRAAAAGRLPGRIAFLGFGLIGGSIAEAIRAAGAAAHLAAWTPSGHGPREGERRGLVDTAAPSVEAALAGADLVILASPPLAILAVVESLGGELREHIDAGATVTDVGSTKARIVAAADASGLRFVGGHPMAGREVSGVEEATANLFAERPWVVVPGRHGTDEDIQRVETLALATGARPIRLAADEHDAAVAAISHLPLVLSAALVASVAGSGDGSTWPLARQLAATGWTDMTRLARGDPEMGSGILATNRDALAGRLVALRDVLQAWIDRLGDDSADAAVIRDELARARRALEDPGSR
jgi:prephenate dehydrogenase